MQADRKKEHKKVIKYIRKFNKYIESDEHIGLNRFRVDVLSEKMYRFSDGSGVELFFIIKMTDTYTGNIACFLADNFDYRNKLGTYVNDFMIRCSDGHRGHIPSLHYVAYDIHTIMPYVGRGNTNKGYEEGIINKYNWLRWDVFGEKDDNKK